MAFSLGLGRFQELGMDGEMVLPVSCLQLDDR
jgi:hypothetical protein